MTAHHFGEVKEEIQAANHIISTAKNRRRMDDLLAVCFLLWSNVQDPI